MTVNSAVQGNLFRKPVWAKWSFIFNHDLITGLLTAGLLDFSDVMKIVTLTSKNFFVYLYTGASQTKDQSSWDRWAIKVNLCKQNH